MVNNTSKPSGPLAKSQAVGPGSTSGASGTDGVRNSLRGHDFSTQEAMLTPSDAVQMAGGAAPVQMEGGHKWKAGITLSDASTFDLGGGHSYADHGAHTTREQHQERLKSGTAPSGRMSKVPASAPGSSKFDSNALHEQALLEAEKQLNAKNTGSAPTKGINGKIGVSGAGTIFKRDGTEETATDVHVDVGVDGGEYNIKTAFPTN